MTKSPPSSSNSSSDTIVLKDYGSSVGKIIKIDLSSNGLLDVIALETNCSISAE